MAEGEIRDITVKLKLDTKDVEKGEGKSKKLFDSTNNAIKTQIKSIDTLNKELKKLVKQRNKSNDPAQIKRLNQSIKEQQKEIRNTRGELEKTTKSSSKFNKVLVNIGRTLLVAFSVQQLVQFTKQLVKTAAQMEVFERRAEVVFGEGIKLVREFAEENAISLGLTRNEFLGAAAAIGDMIVPLGLSRERAASMSVELLKTGVALKEFTGDSRDASEISDILARSLTGEVESLKPLGVSISQNSKEFKALVQQKIQDEGATELQAKALAIYESILQRSSDAIVSFDENTESLTRSQNELTANVKTLNEELAILLLPTFKAVTNAILENVESINEAETRWGKFGQVIARTLGPQAAFVIIQDALTKSTGEATDEIDDMIGALGILDENAIGVTESIFGIIGALGMLTEETEDGSKSQIKNLFFVTEEIKKLRKEQTAQGTSLERIAEINRELIPLQERRKELLGQETDAMRAQSKALEDLAKANKAFRDQVFSDISAAVKRIEDLQIGNIESEFVRDIRRIEKNRERALKDVEDTLATDEQKKIELIEQQDKFDNEIIKRNEENAEKIKKIKEKEKDDVITLKQEEIDAISALALTGLSFFGNIQQAQTNLRITALEKQGLSDEEFDIKRKQILREDAEAKQKLALFEIAINTAKAVAEASPNVALIALAIALGAAQLAVVATTPIPQFAEGTLDAPGGLSMVGERGRELTVLPSGTKVLPNDKTEKYAGVIDSMFRNKFDQYIMERYVPDMLMTDTDGEVYNDHQLKGAVRNSRFNRANAEWIGRSVAKHTTSRAYLMNRYG